MAARLALSAAVVTTTEQVYDPVTITTPNNRARISDQKTGEILLERGEVAAVRNVRRNREWTIVFEDGTEWTVLRSALGCGCG